MPKNDANLHDPLEPVRERYREAFPDFAEGRLRTEIVYEIAWLLVQAGVQPTMAAVTAVHGSGSPNLIHPALKTFFATELKARLSFPKESEPDVPAPLRALWTKALSLATKSVEEELEDARADLDDAKNTLKVDQDALARAEIALEERASRLDADHRALRRRAATALREQRDAGRRLKFAESEAARDAESARMHEEAAHAAHAQCAALEREQLTLRRALAEGESTLRVAEHATRVAEDALAAAHRERAEIEARHHDHLAAAASEADALRAEIVEVRSASVRDTDAWSAMLIAARAQEASLAKALESATAQLTATLDDARRVAAEHRALMSDLSQWRERCIKSESTVEALEQALKERQARLDAVLAQRPDTPD